MTPDRHPLPSLWQRRFDEERSKLEDERDESRRLRVLLHRAEDDRDRWRRAFLWVSGGCVAAFVLSALWAIGRMT